MRLVIEIFDHRAAKQRTARRSTPSAPSASRSSADAVSHRSGSLQQPQPRLEELGSLDTYTGLPFELEQEITSKYNSLDSPVRLPVSIWDDLSDPSSFPEAAVTDQALPPPRPPPQSEVNDSQTSSRTLHTAAESARRHQQHRLNASAPAFQPGRGAYRHQPPESSFESHSIDVHTTSRQIVSETIKPVFASLRTLDWRFGLIRVDYIEAPIDTSATWASASSAVMMSPGSSSFELPAIFEKHPRNRSDSAHKECNQSCRKGTINLGYGLIHLYRDPTDNSPDDIAAGLQPTPSCSKSAARSHTENVADTEEEQGSKLVAVLAVPSNWAISDFLEFIGPVVPNIEQMRLMRDALPNRFMALIKFRKASEALAFQNEYDSRPYNDMLLDEICHIVRITSVDIKTSAVPPYTVAFPHADQEDHSDATTRKEKGLSELPTCPVCLERMDASVSGLITVQCSHTFHCLCLKGWTTNNCPVCRYSQGRSGKGERAWDGPLPSMCAVCATTESLWMCLICGHVGCGRFSNRHAHDHFEETGHTYAYELESQRVWDYAGDQYVHRLIQSKTDGKLVELPSGGPGAGKTGPHGAAGDEIAKIEAISIEFSELLTTQLESQRSYYADKMAQLKDELADSRLRRDEALAEVRAFKKQLGELKQQHAADQRARQDEENALRARLALLEMEQIPSLERDRQRMEKKLEKATDLARSLHKDLDGERSVTRGLMDKIGILKEENEKRKEERDGMQAQIQDLSEQLQDVLFTLSAQAQIAENGGAGGDVIIEQKPSANKASRISGNQGSRQTPSQARRKR